MKKSIAGNLVKFTFEDNVPPLTFDCTKMSGTNRAYAIPFAMCHRLGDAAALSRKQADGTIINITEAMRREAVAELATHYESGTEAWEMKGSRDASQNPTILAIAAKRGCTYEQAEAFLAEQFLAELEA
jgi:hypothetical protein